MKFWWVLYNKKELLPTAKNRNTCPPCLASRLLTGCTFQYCVALSSGMSLLVATSLPFPAGWASLSAVGLMGVSGGTSPLLRDNVSLNQLMKDNWKENKSSWYFGIRSFLNLLAWSNSSTWWKTVSCMKSHACFLFSPSRIHIWHIKWGRAFLIKSKGEAESMWWHLFPHTYNSFLSSHVLLDAKS